MRPTEAQMQSLLDFLERNPGITKGHLRTAMGKMETKRKWQELSNTLNSLGGAVKDGPGWAKFWTDKKYALKKLQSARNQSANRTGGGRDLLPEISPIEERMLALLGGTRFATGDREFSVPLIHQTDTEDIVVEHPPSPVVPYPQEDNEVMEFFGDIFQPAQASMRRRPQSTSPPRPLQPTGSPILPQLITPRPHHTQPTNSRIPDPTNTQRFPQPNREPRLNMADSRERARQRRETARPYQSSSRSNLRDERDRLINIEAKRVEAELLHAQSIAAIASAINRLADGVSAISQSINRIIEER